MEEFDYSKSLLTGQKKAATGEGKRGGGGAPERRKTYIDRISGHKRKMQGVAQSDALRFR
jgi:hypothetical protein